MLGCSEGRQQCVLERQFWYPMKAVLLINRFLVLLGVLCAFVEANHSALGAQTLLSSGATWRYLDTGANLGTTWRATNFNDAAWLSGPAPLGYGDPVATTVGFGEDPNNKYTTTYFRTRFEVNNPSLYGSVEVRLRRDDGGVERV